MWQGQGLELELSSLQLTFVRGAQEESLPAQSPNQGEKYP
ncbi:MAG: hypothetical protein RLZZ160_568, partial [Actinomycetota bacterium]